MDVPSTTVSLHTNYPRQYIAPNSLLIWIDPNIDESSNDYQKTLAQLRNIVNEVNIFTQPDAGIDCLTKADDMKVFLIVEAAIGQQIISLIHDIPQLNTIYIFGENEFHHEQWAKKYIKVKNMHTDNKFICEALQLAVKQSNQDSIAISFIPMDESTSITNLNQLEPTFMYTQIFKEILLEMKHNEQSIKTLVQFWRSHYTRNIVKLNDIAEFENNYRAESAIHWYTREYFLYQMLNQSLRTMESRTIIYMGFFIRDLHEQIQQLYQNQVDSYHGNSFTVYRGQGLLKTDFERLVKTKGGLMSFNNFLSTSKNLLTSLGYARSAVGSTDMVSILFKITINSSVSSVPFASINDRSYFQTEEEILFSMHSIFRIGTIDEIDDENPIYQVNLTLTADDDQQLRTLTEYIQKEIVGETGWQRLGKLLIKISQFDEAEQLYHVLLEQTSNQSETAHYYHHLGYTKKGQGNYEKAIEYYKKALEVKEKILPPNHLSLATSYNNIGMVYQNMGQYSKALLYFEKDLEICQKTLPSNHPDLATSYTNIGTVYHYMGEYPQALQFFEKALEIREKMLPSNHPDLGASYNNIGSVYDNMGDYSKALSFFGQALEIRKISLPSNNPDLAVSYNNIGSVYKNMRNYSEALLFYEKAMQIKQKTLPTNHPSLASSYQNIAVVYTYMQEHSKALPFLEKALEIREKILPPHHPDLATSYNSIGAVYQFLGDHVKSISFLEKALAIRETILSLNHPDLANSYINIATMYSYTGEHSKALSFFERALDITKRSRLPNHPYIKKIEESIEIVKEKLAAHI